MNQEKQFYLPTNICNNVDYIKGNQKNFERNFVRADNLEGNKIFQKHQYISSRPTPTGPCFPTPNPAKKDCSEKVNYCSGYSTLVNQESDLYRLYNYDTKCPKLKMKMKYIDNPSSISNSEQNLGVNQPLVGIINPYCNLKENSIFGVNKCFNKNITQKCLDSSRLPFCDFDNYLTGNNVAASKSDVRNNQDGQSCRPLGENHWKNYLQISNISSDIRCQPIKNEIVNYQFVESNPFMLEDIRVLKKPDSKIQPCQNLFNNMSRRKCLLSPN